MKMWSKRKVIFLILCFDVVGMIYLFATTSLETKLQSRDENLTYVTSSNIRVTSGDVSTLSQNLDTFIYSAYAEEVEKGAYSLRIIGVALNRNRTLLKETILCRLWYNKTNNKQTTTTVRGFVENIPEDHDLNYTAVYFICALHHLPVPDTVTVINNSKYQEVSVQVTRISDLKQKHPFTVCVSPLHSGYNNSAQLLEWIELNAILGVQKFNIYVKNVSNEILDILRYYQGEGRVDILSWSLPNHLCSFDETSTLLHSCGQLAALNDCLYRTKGRSHYIASLDLDEFIIPQNKDDITWSDMLARLPVDSGYLFLNSFISASTAAEHQNYMKSRLVTISYLTRDNVIFIGRVRSKIIARTDRVITLGVHNVWKFTSGRERAVYPDEGLLHHYRDKLVEYPKDIPVTRFKTNVTLKYRKDLRERVLFVRNSLKDFHF